MVFDIILTVMGGIIIILLLILLFTRKKGASSGQREADIKSYVKEGVSDLAPLLLASIESTNKAFSLAITEKIDELKKEMRALTENNEKGYISFIEKLSSSINEMSKLVREENERATNNLNKRFEEFSRAMAEKYEQIEKGVDKSLGEIRRENKEKLDEIQRAVDEKLQKALDERLKASFDNVVSQIGNVNKAIGEIKNIAQDVGSLKNVLTNVKTKGIVGEVMLGSIISEILTKDQYRENYSCKKGSKEAVEFAIKMPSNDETDIYLPIDSKFPLETYYKIKDATNNGDKGELDSARKELRGKLRAYAKDISTKYINVPHTTDFAIMFLPIEGLYIEALEGGLFEELQREYRINIVGPSTLAALLNALRSGLNSLAIQKRSGEVFKLLEAIKSEFETFAKALSSAQTKVNQVSNELEALVGTRTRQMQKKLKEISIMPLDEARQIIDEE